MQLPDDIYKKLPPILRNITDQFGPGQKQQKDLFLISSLTVIAPLLVNVQIKTNNADLHPLLHTCIVSNDTQNMTGMRLAKKLLDKPEETIQKREVTSVFQSGSLFLPSGGDFKKFCKGLDENKGKGLLFIEDISFLTNDNEFSRKWTVELHELIKRSFDQEFYSCNEDDFNTELVEIKNPSPSSLLVGEKKEVNNLKLSMYDFEFSRCLYFLNQDEQSDAASPRPGQNHIMKASDHLNRLLQRLANRKTPIKLYFKKQEKKRLTDYIDSERKLNTPDKSGVDEEGVLITKTAQRIAGILKILWSDLNAKDKSLADNNQDQSLINEDDLDVAIKLCQYFTKSYLKITSLQWHESLYILGSHLKIPIARWGINFLLET